jgi:outer membrane protein OmpA-like peptidoglycan-associated protein
MKGFYLTVFLSLAVVIASCGTTHSMVKGSSNAKKNSQIQAFLGLGEVERTMKGIQVTVSADAIFKKHSSRLSHDGTVKVDAIAAALLKYPNDQVVVVGFTDNSGTDMKNVAFSQLRAHSVKSELIKQGLLAANISAVGNGPVEAVAPNDTEIDKAKNRRIVFLISSPDTAAER